MNYDKIEALYISSEVTYFNEIRRVDMYPPPKPQYLFPDSKFLEGLYIKVLIPLVDED